MNISLLQGKERFLQRAFSFTIKSGDTHVKGRYNLLCPEVRGNMLHTKEGRSDHERQSNRSKETGQKENKGCHLCEGFFGQFRAGEFDREPDLPGFDKKDINIGLKNGILTVSASHSENNDEKDEKTGKYLRRERSASSYQRSFNVGTDVKPEEINAKYENGVLTLTVPNKSAAVEQKDDVKQIEVK